MTLPTGLSTARVAIIGLGLMGGSLAMALRGRCALLAGVDNDPEICRQALAQGVVDRVSSDPTQVLEDANFVILATPVQVILEILPGLPGWIPGEAAVMDLGSTKQAVIQAMGALPGRLAAVGGHPMCGKEVGGLANAEAGLFQNATFALTPLETTPEAALRLAEALVLAVGAQPAWMGAAEHDRWAAATSHLPYLLSAALARATPTEAARLVGPGFRSASRLAVTPAAMILPVLGAAPGGAGGNRDQILAALGGFRRELDRLQEHLQSQNWEALAADLQAASQQQVQLTGPGSVKAEPASAQRVASRPNRETDGAARRVQRLSGNFFANLEGEVRRLE